MTVEEYFRSYIPNWERSQTKEPLEELIQSHQRLMNEMRVGRSCWFCRAKMKVYRWVMNWDMR